VRASPLPHEHRFFPEPGGATTTVTRAVDGATSAWLFAARRIPGRDVPPYLVAQVLGAIVGAGILAVIANGTAGFAANGFGDRSPGGYGVLAALVAEVVLTALFLLVILGATDRGRPPVMAPLAIGLALTLIHLISIPVTNTSVNPARSLGPAVFVGGWALEQLWLF
jgi:aquaporin Z